MTTFGKLPGYYSTNECLEMINKPQFFLAVKRLKISPLENSVGKYKYKYYSETQLQQIKDFIKEESIRYKANKSKKSTDLNTAQTTQLLGVKYNRFKRAAERLGISPREEESQKWYSQEQIQKIEKELKRTKTQYKLNMEIHERNKHLKEEETTDVFQYMNNRLHKK